VRGFMGERCSERALLHLFYTDIPPILCINGEVIQQVPRPTHVRYGMIHPHLFNCKPPNKIVKSTIRHQIISQN
jgi:hypothetical protein